jgi:hypothetical protein
MTSLSPFPDVSQVESALSLGRGPEFDRANESLDRLARALDLILEAAREQGVTLSHDPVRLAALFVSHAENLHRNRTSDTTPHSC